MSGQPDCASTWSHTVSLFAWACCPLALAVAATTPSATAASAATKIRDLIHVSLSRRRAISTLIRRGLRVCARESVRRLVCTSWPRRGYCTPDRFLSRRSALRAAELGDDPVAVAPVDRLHELDRPVGLVAARPLEKEGRRMERPPEGGRLLLVRHRRLDRLRTAGDLDPVAVAVELVERAPEILGLEAGDERLRQVERLDRHRLAVGGAQTLDYQDFLGRGDMEEPAETGSGELGLE